MYAITHSRYPVEKSVTLASTITAIPSSKVTEMAATILMRSQQVVSLLPTVSILNILCSENKRPGP
ncbi:hypothetical protein J6590_013095 [Homalodisca vitripennis]|nr:hypothetical protein J6590_013095 [Homalodisca vitripennis]